MKLLTVDTLDEAREKILAHVKSWPLESETVSLNAARNCIIAKDLCSQDDIPGFARATVDGYALVAADTAGAGEAIPVFLKLAGTVSMGKSADFSIRSGECAYVPTGGMLPGGADAVVMVEYCEGQGGNVAVYEAVASGAGMALAGEDVKKGSLLLRHGTLIRPQEAGALAAAGLTSVQVFAPLKVSIISTGDELVPPDSVPRPGEIRDINSHALKALAETLGYSVVSARTFPDDEGKLIAAITDAIALCDIVVISGGSSQGEKDITANLINRVAKPGVFTHGLALKPGKPTILGWDEKSQTLFAGLPGHPVAAMIVFKLLLGWLTFQLFGRQEPFPIPAAISCNLPGSPGRTLCQPIVLRLEGETLKGETLENDTLESDTLESETYIAEPVFGKSGMITTLTRADGYIIVDLNKEGLKKGEAVLVHLF